MASAADDPQEQSPPNAARDQLAESALSVADVQAQLRDHYGLDGDLTRIATEKDDTYRLDLASAEADVPRRWLVKASAADESPDAIALQTGAMAWLEQRVASLPVQRVRRDISGNPFVALNGSHVGRTLRVLQWVDGMPWAECAVEAPTLQAIGELHASVTRGLAGYTHPAATRFMKWDVRYLPTLRPLLECIQDTRQRRLGELLIDRFDTAVTPHLPRCEQQVVHADVSPYNVILRAVEGAPASVAGLIDFGDIIHTALICDLAVPLANCLSAEAAQPWADASTYLQSFCSSRPLRPQELELLALAAPGRLLMRILLTEQVLQNDLERGEYLRQHAHRDWANLEAALDVPVHQVRATLLNSVDTHAVSD